MQSSKVCSLRVKGPKLTKQKQKRNVQILLFLFRLILATFTRRRKTNKYWLYSMDLRVCPPLARYLSFFNTEHTYINKLLCIETWTQPNWMLTKRAFYLISNRTQFIFVFFYIFFLFAFMHWFSSCTHCTRVSLSFLSMAFSFVFFFWSNKNLKVQIMQHIELPNTAEYCVYYT